MKGLESYKVGKQNFNLTIQPNDLQITDKILEAEAELPLIITTSGKSWSVLPLERKSFDCA